MKIEDVSPSDIRLLDHIVSMEEVMERGERSKLSSQLKKEIESVREDLIKLAPLLGDEVAKTDFNNDLDESVRNLLKATAEGNEATCAENIQQLRRKIQSTKTALSKGAGRE